MQDLEEIKDIINSDIENIRQFLGDEADNLLNFNNPKIKKESLNLPGPDFVCKCILYSKSNLF